LNKHIIPAALAALFMAGATAPAFAAYQLQMHSKGIRSAVPTPSVLAITPGPYLYENGPSRSATISGEGFQSGATVSVGANNGLAALISNAAHLQFSIPTGLVPGIYGVSVRNPRGTPGELANAVQIVATPRVTSLSPNSAFTAGGIQSTITGEGFIPAAGLTVTFGSSAVAATVVNETTATVTVPAAASAGTVSVSLSSTDSFGNVATGSLANAFTYVPSCGNGKQVFTTAAVTSVTVPAGCTTATIKAWGAAGGTTYYNGSYNRVGQGGGYGGYAQGTVSVTPGATLSVKVGAAGQPGQNVGDPSFSGGGGGDYSGVFSSATRTQATALVIAGGGGGASHNTGTTGFVSADGGGTTGGTISSLNGSTVAGGTQTSGGSPLGSGDQTAGRNGRGGAGGGYYSGLDGVACAGSNCWGYGGGSPGSAGSGFVVSGATGAVLTRRTSGGGVPNASDPDYALASGYKPGLPGPSNGATSNRGFVVIQWGQ
jgi:hypothetical protein